MAKKKVHLKDWKDKGDKVKLIYDFDQSAFITIVTETAVATSTVIH